MSDVLTIAGKQFSSRLFLGTGKYASPEQTVAALDASGTELVTVAIRRLDLDNPNARTELDYIDWSRYTVLPNTAGCKTVDEALLTARLGRSVTGSNWVKLEVIPDPKYLLPDPIGTLRAAEQLIVRRLRRPALHPRRPRAREASRGGRLRDRDAARLGHRLRPGHPHPRRDQDHHRERARARRRRCRHRRAVRRRARDGDRRRRRARQHRRREVAGPAAMAAAMRQGVEAGREAYLAGRIAAKAYASASSPTEGVAPSPRAPHDASD